MNKSLKRIALLLDKSGSYDRGLIRGIVRFSSFSSPWEFFLEAPNYTVPDEKKRLLRKVRSWKPDCIVMNESSLIAEFIDLGVPVFVTPSNKLIKGVINIIADDDKIGELGAKYFIDKGFKNFGFYGSDQIFWSRKRKSSFKRLVRSLNLNFYELEAMLNDNWQNNPGLIVDWIRSIPKPAAIMACSDEFGIHLIESAKIANIKVPQEMAILGVDNDEFICELYNPPMSSIDQDPESVGFEIGKYIRSLSSDKNTITANIVGTNFRIVSRLSTDIVAVEDAEVKKALLFIHEKAQSRPVPVEDVVSSTFLSRRILEIRFRKMLNRTILEEINRIRLDAICNKLIVSKSPINEIAYSLGFNSPTSFSNYFRKQ